MRLSIVIPVYNVEKYLRNCLDSVLDQDLQPIDYEIIIVNDGSTDGSLQIAQDYAKLNPHIKVIDKKNGGVASARNCGMDAAIGKFIYFIDSDDYLESNCLKKLVDTCEDERLDILTFLSSSFTDSSSALRLLMTEKDFSNSFGNQMLSPIVAGDEYVANVNYKSEIWWFLMDREFLKNTGIRFLEGRWLEDVIFSIQIILKAKRIAHLQLDVHRYRIAPGTAMTSKEPSHYLKIIRDLQNAAGFFVPVISDLEKRNVNPECIRRIKARQQSSVFFSMIRMLKSTMTFDEVKLRMDEMSKIKAFPLNSFLGKDYKGITYHILVKLFNSKRRFYFFFRLLNPLLKQRYKFSNS